MSFKIPKFGVSTTSALLWPPIRVKDKVQYGMVTYHSYLVPPVSPPREPVKSKKILIGWLPYGTIPMAAMEMKFRVQVSPGALVEVW